jgi:hypothetical protein
LPLFGNVLHLDAQLEVALLQFGILCLYLGGSLSYPREFLLTALELFALALELNSQFVIEFLHLLKFPLEGESILFEHVVVWPALPLLVETYSGLQFGDYLVLLSHFFGQHLKALLLLLALHLLASQVLLDLLVRAALLLPQEDHLLGEFEHSSSESLQFLSLFPL